MAFESLRANYPVAGAFVNALLSDYPNAVYETIAEEEASPQAYEDHYLDNDELCEQVADVITSFGPREQGQLQDKQAILTGIRWAVAVVNNADIEYATILREGGNREAETTVKKCLDIYAEALIIGDNDVMIDVVEACMPFADPENVTPSYCRIGMLIGFLLIDNGYRESVAKNEKLVAMVGPRTLELVDAFHYVPSADDGVRYGESLN